MEIASYLDVENDKHVRGWAIRAIYAGVQFDHEFWRAYTGDLPPHYRTAMLEACTVNLRRIESIARQAGVDLDD